MKLNIIIKMYFPMHFIIIGYGLLLIGALVFPSKPWLTPIFSVFGFLLTSTHYRFQIDTEKKEFKDFLWILGFKKGMTGSFQKINFIYISSSRYNQSHGSIAVRFDRSIKYYEGFIRLDDKNDIYIAENRDKHIIYEKLSDYSNSLDVLLKDFS